MIPLPDFSMTETENAPAAARETARESIRENDSVRSPMIPEGPLNADEVMDSDADLFHEECDGDNENVSSETLFDGRPEPR